MDIHHLQLNRQLKINDTVYIYKNIIDKLWLKIQDIDNDNNGTSYIYTIPNFIFGEPQYNRDIAHAVICRKLKKGGFELHTYFSNDSYIIFISWSNSMYEERHSLKNAGTDKQNNLKKHNPKGALRKKQDSSSSKTISFSLNNSSNQNKSKGHYSGPKKISFR